MSLDVKIKITGDAKGVEQAAKKSSDALRSIGDAARRTADASDNMGKRMAGTLGKAYAAIGVLKSLGDVARDMLNVSRTFDSVNKSLTVTSGSAANAERSMEFVSQTSQRLGVDLASSAKAFADLQASANGTVMEGENTRKIFFSVSQAMAALGKSSADTQGALLAISQMMSKGTVSAEELRGQLGERLPGAFNLMAKALGVSTEELSQLLEQGKVGIDVLPKFAAELDKVYSGAKFDGIENSLSRIGNAWDRLLAASGKAIQLDVVLKAVADIVTPEAQTRYTDLVERRNALNSMIGRRERFGVKAADYKHELAGINKELDAMDRKQAASDKFNPRFGAPMASTYAEYDDIIAQGQKLAEWQKMINQGQADAQERLWAQNRKRIEEQERRSQKAIESAESAAKKLDDLFANTALNLEKQIALHGDNSAAAEMEFEVQYGGLTKLNEAQKIRLLNLAAESDFVEENARRQQAAWDQLVADANEFVDITKAIKEFAAGDVSQSGFNSLLGRIRGDLDAGIISAEQAKEKFNDLGAAFNEGFVAPAKTGVDEMSEFAKRAAQNMQDAFADFLFAPFDKGMSGMLEGFVKVVRRMAAEAASAQVMNTLFGKEGAGGQRDFGGGLLGAAFNGIASLFHDGGTVGAGGRSVSVPAAVFAGAPRLHNGGYLKPDEVPAILQTGEMVLSRKQVASMQGGSGDVQIHTTVTVNGNASGDNARDLGHLVTSRVREVIISEKRPGGLLA